VNDDPERSDPSEIEQHAIHLHVPGILRLLSEHLYSDPKVALREMIQNAHDSCERRRIERGEVDGWMPRIEIETDLMQRLLIIRDNGSGLTRQEIQDYLATVGRGYTGELRERLQAGGRQEALALIGQFGLGLLSAFLVADELRLASQRGNGSALESKVAGWRELNAKNRDLLSHCT
jgi:molecular chaperone HtpG